MPVELKLPSTLFGRQAELDKLEKSYTECKQSSGQLVILTGSGGSGKSSLVQTFAQDKLICSSKFHTHQREPYSAVVDVMYSLCCESLASTPEGRQELSDALEHVLLDESVLRTVLPRLYEAVGSNKSNNKRTADKRQGTVMVESNVARLCSALFNLLRSICKPSRPVILFIDDLHSADEASLNLIRSLSESMCELKGLLLVVAYRNDEESSQSVASRFNDNKLASKEAVSSLHLESLDLDATNSLVAQTLQRNPVDTMPLAHVLYQKTRGNPFYLRRAMLNLARKGRIYIESYKWEWRDASQLAEEMAISDNVVELVASSIEELPKETQEALKVASCLGGQFRTSVIDEYFQRYPVESLENERRNVDDVMKIALDEDLVTRRPSSSTYLWSHDRLQQAAYSLVPQGKERTTIHLRLGTLLKELSDEHPEEQWMVFLAADQLNNGSALITDEDACEDLARLNLEASNLSRSKSAFVPAARLARKGLSLLDEGIRWTEKNYDLCLELFSSLCELESMLGNHAAVKEAVDQVVGNAKCADDSFRAQTAYIESLQAQRKSGEAVEAICTALASYGMRLSPKPNKFQVRMEERKMKRSLGKMSVDAVANLPTMTDPIALRKMQLLGQLYFIAGASRQNNVWAVGAMRGIRLSLTNGRHDVTGTAFGSMAMLSALNGNVKEAYEYCEIAIGLFEKVVDQIWRTRMLVGLHSAVLHVKQPFHTSLDAYMDYYRTGIEYGDLEYGLVAAYWYCYSYLLSGLPLDPVASDLRGFIDQARSYQQPRTLSQSFQTQLQMVLNLQGKSRGNPLLLTGDTMDEQASLEEFDGTSLSSVKRDIFTARLQLAYVYGDLDVGEAMVAELKGYPTDLVIQRQHHRDAYIALMAFALARRSTGKKNTCQAQGRKLMKAFERQSKQGSTNAFPIYSFLRAEDASIGSKDMDSVKLLYDDAIKVSTRSGLLDLAALACERGGQYFLEQDKGDSIASFYLCRALDLYDTWGAVGKVAHMRTKYGKLVSQAAGKQKGSCLKARERFMAEDSLRIKTFDLD